MTDWATISALATGGGTLVLAIATFASVRTSNRAARVAELALEEQRQQMAEARRPILSQSRLEDPTQKIMFREGHWVRAAGSHAVAEHQDDTVYLVISVRNVGAGIGVLQAWHVRAGQPSGTEPHRPEDEFRSQTRDLYIPAGDIGLWQGALRDADGSQAEVAEAIQRGAPLTIELLYSDQTGGQRTISRFGVTAMPPDEHGERAWLAAVNRHWHLDQPGPR